ncbi:MAG: DEAD/DEAH box helicase [Bacteroidetes bacterium]|nr:MAG: DEAD/DEAH box helicase [Bacteroidota bacterium]
MSLDPKYRLLIQEHPELLAGVDRLIQKIKVGHRFNNIEISGDDLSKIELAKDLCELKIIELWSDHETESFKALCSVYFDLATEISIDPSNEVSVLEYLKIISCGYLGESWHRVSQFIAANNDVIQNISFQEGWNHRLLHTSFLAIIGLINKKNWHDINVSIGLINSLRQEQDEFERGYLNTIDENDKVQSVVELISLYHFAKSVEILGHYVHEGRPLEAEVEIAYHINKATENAEKVDNISLIMMFRYFDAMASKMIRNTIWYNTRGVNSRVTRFNDFVSKKEERGIFELLYPQKVALNDLLNPAHNAIVVNMPTSSGKTMIAEYRILMALNQFAQDGGWVAYIAPTRALVNQTYNQLKNDLNPIGIKVEKLSGAVELDGFEESLLNRDQTDRVFDVLVTTYEKLHLMIRQGYGTTAERPLVLAVVDEAHNIEESGRGLNLELLLSTIKNDCPSSNFLLLTPDISNSQEIASWLGGERGKEIHINLHWWQPNERVIGALTAEGSGREYEINLKTLLTNKGTYQINDDILLKSSNKNDPPVSRLKTKKTFASILGSHVICIEEPSVIVADDPSSAFDIANHLWENCDNVFDLDEDVNLLIKYVKDELGASFPLSQYLEKRIGVHSSAIPDEIKYLQEDLMSKGKLQVLVATTTIAQGINFPISSVIMSSKRYPYSEMPVRDFWNLAGRVGRAGQKSLGWVGIVSKDDLDLLDITNYVQRAADDLKSQLVNIINAALSQPDISFERWLFRDPRWSGILQYISHLYNQSGDLGVLITRLEQKLQNTLGYNHLDREQKEYIQTNLRRYAENLSSSDAKLSDSTGFSTVSVRKLLGGLSSLGMNQGDWNRNHLFSENNQKLKDLVGLMLNTPEIRNQVKQLSPSQQTFDQTSISRMMVDWVNGRSINFIADKYFSAQQDQRKRIEMCSKAMYSHMANAATWGLAAIQKMPNSGAGWDQLSDLDKKKMANLPALLHYGVSSDEAVLMRKSNIPRSIAKRVGELYLASHGEQIFNRSSSEVNGWINSLPQDTWNTFTGSDSMLTGREYQTIWKKLSGNG